MIFTNMITLDNRLSLAASMVCGRVAADIGTDHAYIPVYLLQSGKCDFCIASDINEGPLTKARENASKYRVADKIHFALTDGLNGLPLSEKGVTDIIICGMGGELIASIINACGYTKSGVNLILQPMSSVEELRAYLNGAGFCTVDESITEAQGKLYQCICCVYDGQTRHSSAAELAIGKVNIEKGYDNPYFSHLVDKLILQTKRKIEGKKKGGSEYSGDAAMLSELEALL